MERADVGEDHLPEGSNRSGLGELRYTEDSI